MILNLVETFGMKDSKSVRRRIAEVVLSADDIELLSSEATSLFRSLTGATRCTRPDIEFAVRKMTHRVHAREGVTLKGFFVI
jgi:hypothetical protein